MKRLKRLLVPVLLGILLLPLLVGSAGGASAAVPAKVVTVQAADCIATREFYDYWNLGSEIFMASGAGSFICPVHFPEAGLHRVVKIRMYCYDGIGGAIIQAYAYRASPRNADWALMGSLKSRNAPAADPLVVTLRRSQISNRRIPVGDGMHFSVSIEGPTNLVLYGFDVWYR